MDAALTAARPLAGPHALRPVDLGPPRLSLPRLIPHSPLAVAVALAMGTFILTRVDIRTKQIDTTIMRQRIGK